MEDKTSKYDHPLSGGGCPDHHWMTLYMLGECTQEESGTIQQHIKGCGRCQDIIAMQKKMNDQPDDTNLIQAPVELTEKAKALVSEKYGHNLLHVKAVFARHVFNLLNTTGEVIFGPLSGPAALLRDQQEDKRSNLLVKETFDDLLVNVEVNRGEGEENSILINATDRKTKKSVKNLRFTLLENDDELESRTSPDGRIKFEEIKPGQYTVEINRPDKLVGAIRFQLIHDDPQ